MDGGSPSRLKVSYDAEADVLYLARAGVEEQAVEVAPGINLELDEKGELLGVEVLNASRVLKEVVESLRRRAAG